MTKIERLSAVVVATTALSIALIVTIAQWRAVPAVYHTGPVEIGEGGFLLALGAALAAVAGLSWRRDGRPHVLWTLTALLSWIWIAVDFAGFSDTLEFRMGVANVQPFIALAVVAMAAGTSLLNRNLLSSARILLACGAILQGLAFVADLHAGTVFAEPNAQSNLSNFYLAFGVAAIMLVAAGIPVRRGGRDVPLLGRLSDFAPAKRLSILWRDIGWWLWRLRHPGSTYADFYVATVRQQLDMGLAHRTLGRYHFSFDVFAKQDRNRSADFGNEGRYTFEQIRALGLPPDCTVADYGCGSLRVGQHFIDYLGAGRYWGLDVTSTFYEDGIALLPADLMRAKAPNLRVITPQTLAECRAAMPGLIFSIHVLMHVPLDEMESYWHNLASLMHPGSRAYITCNIADRPVRTAAVNWAYPEAMLRAAIERAAPGRPIDFTVSDREKRLGGVVFRRASIIIGTRST